MAVGVILVFRSTRVINFAIGEMGGFAAALLARLVINWGVDFWLAFVAVHRRSARSSAPRSSCRSCAGCSRAPRVILLVATIGAAQLLLFLPVRPARARQLVARVPHRRSPFTWESAAPDRAERARHGARRDPAARWSRSRCFLNRTKYGLAIRASAAQPRRRAPGRRSTSSGCRRSSGSLAGALARIATDARGAAHDGQLASESHARARAAAARARRRAHRRHGVDAGGRCWRRRDRRHRERCSSTTTRRARAARRRPARRRAARVCSSLARARSHAEVGTRGVGRSRPGPPDAARAARRCGGCGASRVWSGSSLALVALVAARRSRTLRRSTFLCSRVLLYRAGRAVAHGAHRLGGPALARPVRLRRRRRHDAPPPWCAPGSTSSRRSSSPRSIATVVAMIVGAPALRHPGPVPRRHDARVRGDDVVVAALARRLPARRTSSRSTSRAGEILDDRRSGRSAPTTSMCLVVLVSSCSSRSRCLRRPARPLADRGARQRAGRGIVRALTRRGSKLTAFGIVGRARRARGRPVRRARRAVRAIAASRRASRCWSSRSP